jgi:hypothetical protein
MGILDYSFDASAPLFPYPSYLLFGIPIRLIDGIRWTHGSFFLWPDDFFRGIVIALRGAAR